MLHIHPAIDVSMVRDLFLEYAKLIGVGESLLTKWVAARPSLAGLPTSLSFIVLFATSFVYGLR